MPMFLMFPNWSQKRKFNCSLIPVDISHAPKYGPQPVVLLTTWQRLNWKTSLETSTHWNFQWKRTNDDTPKSTFIRCEVLKIVQILQMIKISQILQMINLLQILWIKKILQILCYTSVPGQNIRLAVRAVCAKQTMLFPLGLRRTQSICTQVIHILRILKFLQILPIEYCKYFFR